MNYKLIYPTGYQINNQFDNNNIDLNVVLENGEVYFATLFTMKNIEYLMKKDYDIYFWAKDMVIVKNLKRTTIKIVVEKLIKTGYLDQSLSKIGTIKSIYGKDKTFEDIKNFDNNLEII